VEDVDGCHPLVSGHCREQVRDTPVRQRQDVEIVERTGSPDQGRDAPSEPSVVVVQEDVVAPASGGHVVHCARNSPPHLEGGRSTLRLGGGRLEERHDLPCLRPRWTRRREPCLRRLLRNGHLGDPRDARRRLARAPEGASPVSMRPGSERKTPRSHRSSRPTTFGSSGVAATSWRRWPNRMISPRASAPLRRVLSLPPDTPRSTNWLERMSQRWPRSMASALGHSASSPRPSPSEERPRRRRRRQSRWSSPMHGSTLRPGRTPECRRHHLASLANAARR